MNFVSGKWRTPNIGPTNTKRTSDMCVDHIITIINGRERSFVGAVVQKTGHGTFSHYRLVLCSNSSSSNSTHSNITAYRDTMRKPLRHQRPAPLASCVAIAIYRSHMSTARMWHVCLFVCCSFTRASVVCHQKRVSSSPSPSSSTSSDISLTTFAQYVCANVCANVCAMSTPVRLRSIDDACLVCVCELCYAVLCCV